MNKPVSAVLHAMAATAALCASLSAHSAVIVLSGAMDSAQVVGPVYQTPCDDNTPVVGSSHFQCDGVTPFSNSTATGFATVTFDTVTLLMTTTAHWTGLTGPADRAHVHDAPLGETRLLDPPNNRFFHEVININYDGNGVLTDSTVPNPVLCTPADTEADCAPETGSLLDVLDMTNDPRWEAFGPGGIGGTIDDMLAVFLGNGLFLDIHTARFPGGEIRAQLQVRTVSEPGAAGLLMLGLGLAAMSMRRTRRAAR
jgi:hypothetical protein